MPMQEMTRLSEDLVINLDQGALPDGTHFAVMLVEEDEAVLSQLHAALPPAWRPEAFSTLDEIDGAPVRPEEPLVLVLGPSQATEPALGQVAGVLKDTAGAGAVLVIDQPSSELMRLALRSGVDDAVGLLQVRSELPGAVSELACRLEKELAASAAAAHAEHQRAGATGAPRGQVTSVFSPKGGVGKSVVAVNLAVALAQQSGEPVAILDLDLQFGDVAVMMRLQPLHTFTDAMSAGDLLDATLLRSFLARHEKSGVYVLGAPTSPSEADRVDPASMLRVLELLKGMFGHVVVDTPPHLSEVVLQAIAESDVVAFVVAMDVPSVKNARLGLQAFELLGLPLEKAVLVLNRADSKVHLAPHDVERALELKIDLSLPSEAVVPQSVNQGVPLLIEYPRSRFAAQVAQLAELVAARTEQPALRP
jgi:pilus assembly protein CpaE